MPYSINLLSNLIKVHGEFKNDFPFELNIDIISNYNNLSISKDDKIILFENQKDKSFVFTYWGHVLEDLTDRNNETNIRKDFGNLFQYKIKIAGLLKEDNEISDLAYSLLRVSNFTKPQNHFSRAYSYLANEDYNTILKGNIFISRTAFGKFVNSLHKEHKINFVQYFIENEPETYFDTKDFIKAIKILNEYIEYHILKPINYLKESSEILREISGEHYDNIGFSDNDGIVYLINKQLDFIKPKNLENTGINQLSEGKDFLESDDSKLKGIVRGLEGFVDSEKVQSQNFKKTNWPILL